MPVIAVECCVIAQLPRLWLDKIDVEQVLPSIAVLIYGEELLWHEEFRIKMLPLVKVHLNMHLFHRKNRTSLGFGFISPSYLTPSSIADAQ